jgi:hypothetical protein
MASLDGTHLNGPAEAATSEPMLRVSTIRKFPLGRLFFTRRIAEAFHDNVASIAIALGRRASGDWETVCEEDAAVNDSALAFGYRILSAYETEHGKVWIITEADRSATTVLLPEEH